MRQLTARAAAPPVEISTRRKSRRGDVPLTRPAMSRPRSDAYRGPSVSVDAWRKVSELSVTVLVSCKLSTDCCTVSLLRGPVSSGSDRVGLRCTEGAPITLLA